MALVEEDPIDLLEFGNSLDVSVNLAVAGHYDLVVVQRQPARYGADGALAAALVQHCPCPLLAVLDATDEGVAQGASSQASADRDGAPRGASKP